MTTKFKAAFDDFEKGNSSLAWSLIKDSEIRKGEGSDDSEHTKSAALKACLLSAWWGLHELSLAMVNRLPAHTETADPVTSFLVMYAHMSRGEMPSNDALKELAGQNRPKLTHWMQTELLGRTRRYEAQLRYITSLNTEERKGSWLKTAVMRSLDHTGVPPEHLKDCSNLIPASIDSTDESFDYCIRRKDTVESPEYRLAQALDESREGQIGVALQKLDDLATQKHLDLDIIFAWLSISISYEGGHESLLNRAEYALDFAPSEQAAKAAISSYILIHHWIKADIQKAYDIAEANYAVLYSDFEPRFRHSLNFLLYIIRLCICRQKFKSWYEPATNAVKKVFVIGESHSLCLTGLTLQIRGEAHSVENRFVMGVKMNHLSNPKIYAAHCVREYLARIDEGVVLITIGEIDTRPDEGMWKHHKKSNDDLSTIIERTVSGFIDFLQSALSKKTGVKCIVQGVPAPNYVDNYQIEDIDEFLNMIRETNLTLRENAIRAGFGFLDLYSPTSNEKGISNGRFHLDNFHISHDFIHCLTIT